jgi:prevent-host-death family protein
MEINIHEAKTHFSKLLKKVEAGEEVTISRAGVPVARLVAAKPAVKDRPLGIFKDSVWIASDFDAPLPKDVLDQWYAPLDSTAPRRKKK